MSLEVSTSTDLLTDRSGIPDLPGRSGFLVPARQMTWALAFPLLSMISDNLPGMNPLIGVRQTGPSSVLVWVDTAGMEGSAVWLVMS